MLIEHCPVLQLVQPESADYLGFSIFTCLCCCWCVSIAALVKSCAVRDANKRGDPNSVTYSREALLLNKISLGMCLSGKNCHIIGVCTPYTLHTMQ